MSMAERELVTSARRRQERQLRSFLRHEELSVKMALARALHHSAQRGGGAESGSGGRDVRRATATEASTPGDVAESLAEPLGDVVQVQRHIVEQLADGAPRLPTLDVPVPQMVDRPVAVLARFDLLVPEQVIEVPRFRVHPASRVQLFAPLRMAEQLVEVPLPARGWCRHQFVTPPARGGHASGTQRGEPIGGSWARTVEHPAGDHRQPRAVYKQG